MPWRSACACDACRGSGGRRHLPPPGVGLGPAALWLKRHRLAGHGDPRPAPPGPAQVRYQYELLRRLIPMLSEGGLPCMTLRNSGPSMSRAPFTAIASSRGAATGRGCSGRTSSGTRLRPLPRRRALPGRQVEPGAALSGPGTDGGRGTARLRAALRGLQVSGRVGPRPGGVPGGGSRHNPGDGAAAGLSTIS